MIVGMVPQRSWASAPGSFELLASGEEQSMPFARSVAASCITSTAARFAPGVGGLAEVVAPGALGTPDETDPPCGTTEAAPAHAESRRAATMHKAWRRASRSISLPSLRTPPGGGSIVLPGTKFPTYRKTQGLLGECAQSPEGPGRVLRTWTEASLDRLRGSVSLRPAKQTENEWLTRSPGPGRSRNRRA
jgi:hypothetical protein